MAYASVTLVASHLNKKRGGNQPVMRDTVWAGKVQKLVCPDGTPKRPAKIWRRGKSMEVYILKLEHMHIILAKHDNFKNENNALETFLWKNGHIALFLPKFHCELNGIERVWGHRKCIVRAHCN